MGPALGVPIDVVRHRGSRRRPSALRTRHPGALQRRGGVRRQGLGLAGGSGWSTVRAHPPLLGLILDVVPGGTSGEVGPRAVAVVLGLLAVVVAGLLARELAGRAAGILSATAVATMPYHSDVTRQVLVEVPMATAAALALLLVVRAARTGQEGLVEVAAVVLGVATLAKETALLTLAAVVLALVHGDPTVSRRTLARSAGWYLGVVALYPAYLSARGSLGTGADYLGWQLGRTGRATGEFYAAEVLPGSARSWSCWPSPGPCSSCESVGGGAGSWCWQSWCRWRSTPCGRWWATRTCSGWSSPSPPWPRRERSPPCARWPGGAVGWRGRRSPR